MREDPSPSFSVSSSQPFATRFGEPGHEFVHDRAGDETGHFHILVDARVDAARPAVFLIVIFRGKFSLPEISSKL